MIKLEETVAVTEVWIEPCPNLGVICIYSSRLEFDKVQVLQQLFS